MDASVERHLFRTYIPIDQNTYAIMNQEKAMTQTIQNIHNEVKKELDIGSYRYQGIESKEKLTKAVLEYKKSSGCGPKSAVP